MAIIRNISVLKQGFVSDIDIVYGTDLVPIEFHITDYDIPENAMATVYCVNHENNKQKILCDIKENVVSFSPVAGFFVVGVNLLQIRITVDEKNLYSFEFIVKCKKNIANDDAEEAESQPTLVTQLLTEVGNVKTLATKSLEQEKTERKNADVAERVERQDADATEKAERKAEIDVERKRIDGFVALKDGSTTGDAELIDGRLDFSGVTWENVGAHIRGISSQLNNTMVYILASADLWELGDYYGAGDGSDIVSTTRLRLKNGYIPNEVVQIDVEAAYRLMLYAYDKDGIYVGRWDETEGWNKTQVSQLISINIIEFKDLYPDYQFKIVIGNKAGGDIDVSAGVNAVLKCIRWITSVDLEETERKLIEKIEAERINLDVEEFKSDNIITALEYGAIGSNGTLSDESNTTGKVVRTSDYIAVSPDEKYTIYARYLQSGYNMAFYICCYDENKNFISRTLHGNGLNVTAGRYIQTFEIPETTAKYIKLYFNTPASNEVYHDWRFDGTDIMLSETEYAIPMSKNEGVLEQINSIRVGAYEEHFDKVDEQISPKNKFWDGVLRESYATYAYAPRNTVESVKVAKELGFKYLKCDCRVTSDDVVVLCHDKTLDITTDYTGNGTIRDMTLEEVKACNIIQTRFSYNVKVATLDEFLHECKKYNIIPFVNLRDEYLDVVVPAVADLLIKYGFDKSAIVQSTDSSLSSLVKFRELNKKCLCMTVLTVDTKVYAPTMEHLNRALSISDCGLIVHDNKGYITSQTEAFTSQSKLIIEEAHKHNIPVMYAIISDKEMEKTVIEIGYDGVMTYAVDETVPDKVLIQTSGGAIKALQIDDSGNITVSEYMPVI